MADNVTVISSIDSITVIDPTTQVPVTVTEDVVSIGSGIDQINITPEQESVQVTETPDPVSVNEVTEIISPEIADVHVQIVEDSEVPYAKRTDFVGDTVIYKGEAAVGALDADPVWRIRKLTIATDGDVKEEWAGSNASFNKNWNDRDVLIYG